MTLTEKTVMARTTRALAFALGLVLLTMPAWGQGGQTGEQGAQRWFRVSCRSIGDDPIEPRAEG